MKRIFILLATAALALVSCVEDNLTPDHAAEGTVTIKAVAADTKTTLDGPAVVWENSDKIKVVYHNYDQNADFSVKGSVSGASANFTGTVNPEWTLDEREHPYAVYPYTAVTKEESTQKTVISHTLPEVQTGTITSGMNLSSAILSEEELAAGNAEAVFHNALTLLQIVVPEGVASVELSAGYGLVGTATFNVDVKDVEGAGTGEYDENYDEIKEITPATGKLTPATLEAGTVKTVTLKDGDALEAKTYNVLVYPTMSGSTSLTLTMTGTDGTEYTNSLEVKLLAGEYRVIDLTKIFGVVAKSEYVVFPAGGTVEIPVTTANDYTVSLSDGAESWISYTVPTKAFHSETIVFTVAPNEGASREATVTITSNGKTTSFKISQEDIFMDFVSTEENPVEWQETFGLYVSEADYESDKAYLANPEAEEYKNYEMKFKEEFTNVFEITLSDDFSKGTYKVSNVLLIDMIWVNGSQVSVGGDFYANYDSETSELTLLSENSSNVGYYLEGDVVLKYDVANKKFTADIFKAAPNYPSAYDDVTSYIAGYTAVVKVEEAGFDKTTLYGTYDESFTIVQYQTPSSPETTVISASDNPSYDLKIQFFYTEGDYSSAYDTAYGVVNADGTQITVTYLSFSFFFATPDPFVLSVADGVLSGVVGTCSDYKATIRADQGGAVDAASLKGTYSEEYATFMGSSSGTMTIDVSGDDISVSMFNGDLVCSATLSDDGKTLTVNSDGCFYKGSSEDLFSGDMTLTVGEEGGKITLGLSTSPMLWGMTFLKSYTATMN